MNMKIDTYTPSGQMNPMNSVSSTNAANSGAAASAATARKLVDNQVVTDQKQEGSKDLSVKDAVNVANDIMKMFDSNARFEYSIDEATKIELIKVIDKNNGELIRQYPPKEIMSMLTKMYDMLGIIVDKKF